MSNEATLAVLAIHNSDEYDSKGIPQLTVPVQDATAAMLEYKNLAKRAYPNANAEGNIILKLTETGLQLAQNATNVETVEQVNTIIEVVEPTSATVGKAIVSDVLTGDVSAFLENKTRRVSRKSQLAKLDKLQLGEHIHFTYISDDEDERENQQKRLYAAVYNYKAKYYASESSTEMRTNRAGDTVPVTLYSRDFKVVAVTREHPLGEGLAIFRNV